MSETEASWTYTNLFSGDQAFLERVGIPFADSLADAFPDHGSSRLNRDPTSPLYMSQSIRMSAGDVIVGMFTGFLLFVSGGIGTKILEDVYETKLRDRVRKLLSAAPAQGKLPPQKRYGVVLALWHEKEGLLIATAILGDSPEQLLLSEAEALNAHRVALAPGTKDRLLAPVQLYIVKNGLASEPLPFRTLDDVCNYLVLPGSVHIAR